MMKKTVLLSIAMLMSVASFAQKKGEMYVAGTFATDFGSYAMSSSVDGYSTSEKTSFGTSFEIGGEYAYFVANNIRLSLGADFSFSSSPSSIVDVKRLKDKTIGFDIVPGVAYYVKLADRFYYTPEIAMLFEWCTIKNQLSQSITESTPVSAWGGYINLLAFEFQASERIAIGVTVGSIEAYSSIYDYKKYDMKYKMNQFFCDLNNGSLHFRWYFNK